MSTFAPVSLAQRFESPEGFEGSFGWLCGFSADDSFMNDAIERFTGRMPNQRAYEGGVSLALMLDPREPQITPVQVPGLMHLLSSSQQLPFNLLHAKVALLGYRHLSRPGQWCLRLLVSTGNWTRQTLEESLDLAWQFDLSSEDLNKPDDSVVLACADITHAWAMLDWLRTYFDARALQASAALIESTQRFEDWIARAKKVAGKQSGRFFDNRKQSLLTQLPTLVEATGSGVARNYLAMGSGFYEACTAGPVVPSVLSRIIETLRGNTDGPRLLTASAEIDLFVNPQSCQGVALTLDALTDYGLTVRAAGQPDFFNSALQRTLHAKFIFSANQRSGSDYASSAWVYLGSGNLTQQGFTRKMSANGGNLEAGVVFAPGALRWSSGKGLPETEVIGNYLPVQWTSKLNQCPDKLASGNEMIIGEEFTLAAPVSFLLWEGADVTDSGWLLPTNETEVEFSLLDPLQQPCKRDPEKGFIWFADRPRQVQVCWTTGSGTHVAIVPVIDRFGRFAATSMPALELGDVWMQLAGFPRLPDAEDLPDAFEDKNSMTLEMAAGYECSTASYPVRQMMELIENIAAKQTAIPACDWTLWCARLEQSLTQAADCSLLAEFLELGLNPLSPLRQASFRPEYAESSISAEGRLYEKVLGSVEAAWQIQELSEFGVSV
ncbi:hypothetical protein [Pseudomonas sp. GM60]|uniref:hypothetical protein n=1 Tax=Pseudomonas sp. GM60 TaxID=1144334 RepID=UPI0002706E7E|nr:hypothetical protein [Pseudomonas sp. GM60]EJM79602.1 hypothetical protein PMI32_04194 [Pseudomonas sp. GM60]